MKLSLVSKQVPFLKRFVLLLQAALVETVSEVESNKESNEINPEWNLKLVIIMINVNLLASLAICEVMGCNKVSSAR